MNRVPGEAPPASPALFHGQPDHQNISTSAPLASTGNRRSARGVVLLIHRYVGLAMALFLIVEGVTGSLLAYNDEIERLIAPELFAPDRPSGAPLALGAIAERAEAAAPEARLLYLIAHPARVMARMEKLQRAEDDSTGGWIDQIFLDPATGAVLGRRRFGDLSQGRINIMPFIFQLHSDLTLGPSGAWILAVIAIAWTLDCLYAVYLTMPRNPKDFWRRWKPSWLIRSSASVFRLNFDVHRAGGLWLWPMLLTFGLSSVMLEMPNFFSAATGALFGGDTDASRIAALSPHDGNPRLGWREAEAAGAKILAGEAAHDGFTIGAPDTLALIAPPGVYSYGAKTSLDLRGRLSEGGVWFDDVSGDMRINLLQTREGPAGAIERWLRALHFGDIRDSAAYRFLVCLSGLLTAALSGTGVYIWWKKRRARKQHEMRAETPGALR